MYGQIYQPIYMYMYDPDRLIGIIVYEAFEIGLYIARSPDKI